MERRITLRSALVGAVVIALITTAGCAKSTSSTQSSQKKGPITVGSKIDTEGELLSSIVKLVLENANFTVVDKSQTGPTDVVRKALLNKEIDIYPEYTGSGITFFPNSNVALYKVGQTGYETVKAEDLKANGVVWLTPAMANNTWAIAAKSSFADAESLTTMSDFAAYVNSGKFTRLAASDEFFTNPDAGPAFEKTYGYKLNAGQQVRLAGGNTAQTEKAVADNTDGVNFGMAYGTDGALSTLGLLVLVDDKHAQVVFWPCPTTRKDVVDKYPEIETLLKPPFEGLTLAKLQELNGRIQVNGEAADTVAKSYLTSGGYLPK